MSQPTAQGRLLDNLTYELDGFKYEIKSEGEVVHFKGRKTIHAANTLVYALDYFGGLVRD